jgi:ATP-binding cassette subfamily C exporter for protease/lipase
MNPPASNMPARPELRDAIWALKPYFVRAFWFSIFASLLVLVPSVYMLEVYDRVVNSRSLTTLLMLTVMVLFAYGVMELLEWARAEVMQEASHALDRKLAPRVFNAILSAQLMRSGPASTQAMSDFRTVREFLYSPALLGILEAPVALVCLAVLFLIHPLLGWAALAGAVVQTLVAWLNERASQPPLQEATRHAIGAQQYADGSLRNAEVIESMGMLRDIHRRWMEKQQEFLRMQAKASDAAGVYQAMTKFVQQVMGSALLGLGAWLLLQGTLAGGGGMMIVGSILGGRVLAPLAAVVVNWRAVGTARDAWNRLEKLLATVPAKPPAMRLPAPRGLLHVEPVVAGAPGGNQPILRGVSFTLPPGELLAVVGPSASGKTTLARLLVGLWPASVGKVRLDGADVYSWDKAELGPHVGYLPQGVELLDGTIAENIARFGELDQHKVEAAARAVGLHEFILDLPEGYDTQVGREGAKLSGGQRQRVGLARALYGDPVYIVLDEPNSSLDEAGDAALAMALQQLKARGATVVVITHRTSVLGLADKMLVLRDGQMQAYGPRDEVLAGLRKAAEQAAAAAQALQPQLQQHPMIRPAASAVGA